MSPVYEFYVYQIFRKRSEPGQAYLKSFLVTAHGHMGAKSYAGKARESFSADIRANNLTMYFRCTKRAGVMACARHPGEVEYKGCMAITKQQVAYFDARRQMNP